MLDEHLGDAERALSNLNAALATEPNNRAALERLLGLQKRHKRFDAAAETAQKLVRVSPELGARVGALLEVGRLERARGQGAAAIQAYEQAVALVGVDGAAARPSSESSWPAKGAKAPANFGPVCQCALALCRKRPRALRRPLSCRRTLELSRVLAEEMAQPEQAVQGAGRAGSARRANNVELAGGAGRRACRRAGQFGACGRGGVDDVLELDVMRADAWRELAEAFKGLGRTAEATLALAPLVALNAANDLERTTLSMRPPRAGAAHAGSFDANEFTPRSICCPQGDRRDTASWRSSRKAWARCTPPEPERHGVSFTRDRISAKSGHLLRALADRVANVFGVEDYDLYLHRAHSGALEIEFTDPVSVMVPSYFAKLGEGQQVFLLARIMANIARNLHAVDRLAPDALELLLAAAARTVDASFGTGLADEDFLNGHARRVTRSLPWLGRGAVEDAAREYAAAPRLDVADWVFRVRLTSARAALIVGA